MVLFQSTQPEWAATRVDLLKDKLVFLFQSTQPEWAATDLSVAELDEKYRISIHAARVGCDKV